MTDKADSPHLLIPKMKAEVLCAVADNDDKREPAAKDKLKEAFAAANLKATVEVYEGCSHGWTVRGSQVYNEAGAERAWGGTNGAVSAKPGCLKAYETPQCARCSARR